MVSQYHQCTSLILMLVAQSYPILQNKHLLLAAIARSWRVKSCCRVMLWSCGHRLIHWRLKETKKNFAQYVHPTSSPALEILTSMSSLLGCFHCHGCFYLQLVPDASRIKLCNHPGGGGLLARNDSNCFRGCWTIGQDCKGGWQQKITTAGY